MIQRIFRSILVVAFFTLAACFAIATAIFYSYFSEALRLELKEEAALAANGVELLQTEYFAEIKTDTRFTWIAADGTVLYDNRADDKIMDNHLNREEVSTALQQGEGFSERFSDTLSQKTVNYALLLKNGTVLRVSSSQQTVWAMLATMLRPALVMSLVILALAILLTFTLSKKIVQQVNAIDLESPMAGEPYEELAPLLFRIDRQNRLIRQQMADLKVKQEEFSAITENMSEGFVLVDRHRNLLSYNSAAAKVFQLEKDRSAGNGNADYFDQIVVRVLAGENLVDKFSFDHRVYQILANPVYSDGNLSGMAAVVLDITEREQQELLRREFTSNVSHELKTPLTTIYGVSEMIVNGIVRPEDISKFVGSIYEESGRLITLVNDILRLSQLDENAILQEKIPVDLYHAAAAVIAQLSAAANAAGVTLLLQGDSAVVDGIPAIINEMIYNLCDNAIKYNREGGNVAVTVGIRENLPYFSVSDTGIGIPPEHIERIFERFYRVDKSHSRRNDGTGLGLSIVKHGAAYHNARLQVESEVGEGTTMSVIF